MKRKADVILHEVVGEYLLVPIGSLVLDMNGMVILNATGRCVWELLSDEHSVDDLAITVAEQFDVDFERARVDVQTFLDEITRLGLLE